MASQSIRILSKTPFAEMQALYAQGLSLIPLGGVDGKSPLVKFAGRKRLPLDVMIKLMVKANSATYGILLDGIVVVDCDTDNEATSAYVAEHFGVSNYQVKTPRGRHLYFKANRAIKGTSIHIEDVDIDIKTGPKNYVVGSGSTRPDGKSYFNDVGSCQSQIKKGPCSGVKRGHLI